MSNEKYYTIENVGKTRSKTPEGYLLCVSVPIAKTGTYDYQSLEVSNVKPKNGIVKITRSEDVLFNNETIASFEGKPVVFGHSRYATPQNWRDISVGIIQNVRRGDGDKSEYLLADLLLTDEKAIKAVENNTLIEVSCGYDAVTVQDEIGKGHYESIEGNHVALVNNARIDGCKIGDSRMTSIRNMFRRAFRSRDEDAFNDVLDKTDIKARFGDEAPEEQEPEKQGDEDQVQENADDLRELVKTTCSKVDAMCEILSRLAEQEKENTEQAEEEPAGDEEPEEAEKPVEAEKQGDEKPEEQEETIGDEEVKRVLADAETICAGLKKPVGDGLNGAFTRSQIERIQRTALKESALAKEFDDISALDGTALNVAFKSAVAMKKATFNPTARVGDSKPANTINLLKSINENARNFWSN